MLVKDAMCRDVKTCTKDSSVKDIATTMCFNRISGLPVVEGDQLVGIVSEKDVLCSMFPDMKELVDSGAKPDFEDMENDYLGVLDKSVSDIMTTVVSTVTPDMPILRAASMMWLRKIRRIPVTEGNKLVGILSMGDVHKLIFQETIMAPGNNS